MENAAVAANKNHRQCQKKVSFLLTSIQAGSWNPTYYTESVYAQAPTQMTAPRSSRHSFEFDLAIPRCNVASYLSLLESESFTVGQDDTLCYCYSQSEAKN